MATTNSKALTVASFEIAPITEEITGIIREELDGLGQIPFDAVKVPGGGGLAFELPGDDSDTPETAQDITGVIVHHHPVNAYWKDAYSGGNQQPDCSSIDGKQGLETATGELHDCAECPYNQFGSAGDGSNSKACKNGHRVYILREGEALPLLLTLPPTSLRAFKDYLAKRIVLKGKRSWHVITRITLKREQNAGGIKYSSCVFAKAGDLSPQQVETLRATVDAVKTFSAAVPVETDAKSTIRADERFLDVNVDDAPF